MKQMRNQPISFEDKYILLFNKRLKVCRDVALQLKKMKPKLNQLSKNGKCLGNFTLLIFDTVEGIIRYI